MFVHHVDFAFANYRGIANLILWFVSVQKEFIDVSLQIGQVIFAV